MRLLLDSHTLLWAVYGSSQLSGNAQALILKDDNDVFYSPVSLYEIAFKASRGRMPAVAMYLPETARLSDFREVPVTSLHLVHAARLDWRHGDPWDRILLAQAILEDLDLISADRAFDSQTGRRIW